MSNTITAILPTILADGVMALRQNAVMARLVNRDLQSQAQKLGNVVNVPIPSAVPARAVTPAVTYAANGDSIPTSAAVTLDQWYEGPIQLSDSDQAAVNAEQFVRMQGSEAVKGLANNVDQTIMAKHTGFFGFAGAAGTTPFAGTLTQAISAMQRLNIQLAPVDMRRGVIDPSAEANFKNVPDVLRFDGRGDQGGIIQGVIGTKLGLDWYMDQNVTSYTPGTAWVSGYTASSLSAAVGQSTMKVTNTTASGSIKVGDIFTVGSGYYVVTVTTTFSATVPSVITFYPALATAVSTDSAITCVATAYTANLAFHRDAWAFASRPLSGVFQAGNVFQAPTDPVSGIALRLELSRQYKQETLSFDILYGTNVVRRELGCKILG